MFTMPELTLTQFKSMNTAAIVKQVQQGPTNLMSGRQVIAVVSAPQAAPTPSPAPSPSPTPAPTGTQLFKNPDAQVNQFVGQYPQLAKIADQPQGIWLGNVYDYVTRIMQKAGAQMPVFVAYNIPGRDNGNYSAGGAGSPDAYYAWIGSVGAAIGSGKAIVILEPDALGLSANIAPDQQQQRYQMVSTAIDILRKQPNVKMYVDASMWVSTDNMAAMMRRANVQKADGFSINVSGYNAQADVERYGNELSGKLGGMHYVVDTSRNGNGPLNDGDQQAWCNPGGRRLGTVPTQNPTNIIDWYLWVKAPGESDGNYDAENKSYDAPSAGSFYLQKALELVQ